MSADAGAFVEVDWDAEVDVQAHLDAVSEGSLMRGMYTSPVVSLALKRSGKKFGRERYVAFKLYPMREHLEVVASCAAAAYPELNLARALRQLGAMAVPTLRGSMVGRTMFALAGGTVRSAFELLSKGHAQARNVGGVRLFEYSQTHAVFTLRDIFDFPESLQVGIIENAAKEAVGVMPKARLRRHGFGSVDIRIDWPEGLVDERGKRITK